MIRAVIDTSVLVSAFIGHADAGPARVMEAWRDRRLVLVASPRLFEELSEVLARPKFGRWADDGRGAAYVAAFAARCELHADPPAVSATRDPDDDFLVALARFASADLIVSVDRDLLEAGLDDVSVVRPYELIGRLDATSRVAQ